VLDDDRGVGEGGQTARQDEEKLLYVEEGFNDQSDIERYRFKECEPVYQLEHEHEAGNRRHGQDCVDIVLAH